MAKKLLFGGPGLPKGNHTFFDDLSAARYAESDLLSERIEGEAALAALSRPGARLFTLGFAGEPAGLAAEAAPEIIAVDPSLVWADVPVLDERGVQKVREGAKPTSYLQRFVNFGDSVPLEHVRNAEYYVQAGFARIVDDTPAAKPSAKTEKPATSEAAPTASP